MATITVKKRANNRILPGFGLTLGFTLVYLSLIVLFPLAMLFVKTHELSPAAFRSTITDPEVIAAFRVSFGASLAAAFFNVFSGTLVAWVLVRYRFIGRSLLDGIVDLPFALPTAVAGISLATIYSLHGWVGSWLEAHNIHVANTTLGVTLALVVVGMPFVIRTVEPVLEDIGVDIEEAAASLGASRGQIFRRIILPAISPAIVTGFTLAFARGLGEYGSVIYISGNIRYQTVIVPYLIMTKLENYDNPGATAIASVMLVISFALLLGINVLQWWARKRQGAA